jgi:hypothetical protein
MPRLIALFALLLATHAAAQPAAPAHDIEVTNDHIWPLNEIYAWPSGATAEGPDRLGAYSLDRGEKLTLRLEGPGCSFELRFVFDDDAVVRRKVDACAPWPVSFAPTSPPKREVAVINRTGAYIMQVFAAPPGAEAWGLDRLGRETLVPERYRRISLNEEGCVFDLRAVLRDGTEQVRRGVDVCADPRLVFGEGGEEEGTHEVTVENGYDAPVAALHLRPFELEDWGTDLPCRSPRPAGGGDGGGGAARPGGLRQPGRRAASRLDHGRDA